MKYLTITMIILFMLACNSDRNELIIKDLQNNGVDTSNLAPVDNSNNNSSGDALGSQVVNLTATIDTSVITQQVTRVRARVFVSRNPEVVSSWQELTESATNVWGVSYTAAPNAGTPFSLHIEAYNGSTMIGVYVGPDQEFANNGDGSAITANVTINTPI